MFSKFQCESGKLPPSKSTLREKIFRSHYTSLVWKSGHLPSPVLPDPKSLAGGGTHLKSRTSQSWQKILSTSGSIIEL